MENKNYSHELKEILTYMTDILINEFPTKTITLEYLVVSILDNKKSHANMFLNNCLTSSNIDELKTVFVSYLRDHTIPNLISNSQNPVFDDSLKTVLDNAEKELNVTKTFIIGSEHVLLSMLNPENQNLKMQEIFRNIGIDYNFLLNKCDDVRKKLTNDVKNSLLNKKIKNQMQNIFPLKSEINPKSLIQKTNFIQNYTIDLTKLADEGKLDELVGRKKEITQLIQVLARRKKNNVVLVGKGGCGKSQIVYGLANMIAANTVPDIMKDKKVVQLNIAALIAGTFLRGAFEERVKGLFEEMKASNKYILFVDDMHTVLKSSSKEKDTDISSMISDVLAEGDIRVIGATSFKDYRNSIETNTMISRRLQKIVIEPSTKEETIEILKNNKHYYEDYHNVTYTDEAIQKCVELSERYITDRSLPDSAIDVLDFSGAHTCLVSRKTSEHLAAEESLEEINLMKTEMLNNGDFESVENLLPRENELKKIISDCEREYRNQVEINKSVITENDIFNAISELTNVPVNVLSSDEKKKLAQINETLKASVIGQDEAIDKICRVIKRNKVGLGNKNKPISTMLLVGKSGCGKTLIAKKLAEEIFGDANSLVRIDMSEYSEKNSVAKLTGAAPGYVGFDNGGQLTEAVKNKQYCVLLLDEIEKADQEVYNIFLQLFDEGRLTDNSGQIVNFKNTIILMTSNVGTKKAQDFGKGIGFVEDASTNNKAIIEKEIKNKFAPEFINRLDQIVYFNDLTVEDINKISKLELDKLINRINAINYNVIYNDDVVEFISNSCSKNREFGARPILRFIQDNIEDAITDKILMGSYDKNHTFYLTVENQQIIVK